MTTPKHTRHSIHSINFDLFFFSLFELTITKEGSKKEKRAQSFPLQKHKNINEPLRVADFSTLHTLPPLFDLLRSREKRSFFKKKNKGLVVYVCYDVTRGFSQLVFIILVSAMKVQKNYFYFLSLFFFNRFLFLFPFLPTGQLLLPALQDVLS